MLRLFRFCLMLNCKLSLCFSFRANGGTLPRLALVWQFYTQNMNLIFRNYVRIVNNEKREKIPILSKRGEEQSTKAPKEERRSNKTIHAPPLAICLALAFNLHLHLTCNLQFANKKIFRQICICTSTCICNFNGILKLFNLQFAPCNLHLPCIICILHYIQNIVIAYITMCH